jgi:serine protease Do
MRPLRFITALLIIAALSLPGAANSAQLPQFADLAEKISDQVVNISTVREVQQRQQMQRFFGPRGRGGPEGPLEDFFDQFEKYFRGMPQRPKKQRSLGSGFIISRDGYIVTNNHVVQKATEIQVNLQNGDSYEAEVVGRDPETDLALIKIEADRNLPTLEFGDSDEARVGSWVLAVGNPFGLDHTVTAGIISAKGRVIGAGPFDNFLQTDASINPGNSGGPLINMDGDVIGINTAIIATGQGIGFAIPSNMAETIIAELKEKGKVTRGWLGVTIQDVDENTAQALGLDEPKGALVASVVEGEPADQAGLRQGDVILSVNGENIEDANALLRTIAGLQPGDSADITVFRQGEEKEFTVTLGIRDTQRMAQRGMEREPEEEAAGRLGLQLKPVNEQEARALGLPEPKGLLVMGVEPGAPAAEAGIRQGDVVLQVNQQDVNSVQAFKEILEDEGEKKGVLLLLVQRRGRSIFVSVPVPER